MEWLNLTTWWEVKLSRWIVLGDMNCYGYQWMTNGYSIWGDSTWQEDGKPNWAIGCILWLTDYDGCCGILNDSTWQQGGIQLHHFLNLTKYIWLWMATNRHQIATSFQEQPMGVEEFFETTNKKSKNSVIQGWWGVEKSWMYRYFMLSNLKIHKILHECEKSMKQLGIGFHKERLLIWWENKITNFDRKGVEGLHLELALAVEHRAASYGNSEREGKLLNKLLFYFLKAYCITFATGIRNSHILGVHIQYCTPGSMSRSTVQMAVLRQDHLLNDE